MPNLIATRRVSPLPPITPAQPPCHFFKFPNELVAETISWLPHPEHILSLSYTCKKMHNILTDPTASYVWKHARERFVVIESCKTGKPSDGTVESGLEIVKIPGQTVQMYLKVVPGPIPAPFDDLSEYAFARMLFGKKTCERCGKLYNGMPWSLVLRIALCPHCEKDSPAKFIQDQFYDRRTAEASYTIKCPGVTVGPGNAFAKLWNSLVKEEHRGDFRLYLHPSGPGRVLQRSWRTLLTEYLDIKDKRQSSKLRHFLDVTLKERTERSMQIQMHGEAVHNWNNRYKHHLSVLKISTAKSAELFALSHGLITEDMLKSPAYRHMEAVSKREHAVDMTSHLMTALSELISQTVKIREKRIAVTTAIAQKTRRTEIEELYKRHPFPQGIKPTLDVFRSMPILQALQRGISTAGVKIDAPKPIVYYMIARGVALTQRAAMGENLREDTVVDLVNAGVMRWRQGAVLGARKLLGYGTIQRKGGKNMKKRKKGGKKKRPAMEADEEAEVEESEVLASVTGPTATIDAADGVQDLDGEVKVDELAGIWHSVPNKLDPEMRATSWFVCTRCTNMDPAYKRMRVLDFRGVCAHECWQKDWSKAQRKNWKIGYFALAPRAMDTAKRMLEILNKDAEDPETSTRLFKGFWACNNCPAWMYGMVWEDLLRHCQRHETQDISLISSEDAQSRRDALGYGERRLTFADLLSGKHDVEARKKQLACVHCRPVTGRISEGHKAVVKGHESEKIMDIHGIRQHMKAKHYVEDCRNEDFYYVSEDRVQGGGSMEVQTITPMKTSKPKPATARGDTIQHFDDMTLHDYAGSPQILGMPF